MKSGGGGGGEEGEEEGEREKEEGANPERVLETCQLSKGFRVLNR